MIFLNLEHALYLLVEDFVEVGLPIEAAVRHIPRKHYHVVLVLAPILEIQLVVILPRLVLSLDTAPPELDVLPAQPPPLPTLLLPAQRV